MTLNELKAYMRAILAAEEQAEIDWHSVENLCDQTLGRLTSEPSPDYPHDTVIHFLDDADVRQKDEGYARVQRERLRCWLGAAS